LLVFGLLQTHYVLLLCAFKEQLQQHVRVHAMEAVMACWDLEQSLQSLTGKFSASFFFGSLDVTLSFFVVIITLSSLGEPNKEREN